MSKFSTFLEFAFYVLLLALPPTVNSNETPTRRMCAVCLEKACANVRRIYSADADTAVWVKAKSPTGIQNCSPENLKPDAPCKMADGSLILQTKERLHFDGMDTSGGWHTFISVDMPCDDLINSKPSLGMCAVCLEKDCATDVIRIYPAGSDTAIWLKENTPAGIQNCSMENLKADVPCKMANGNLVQLANEMLQFDSMHDRGVRHTFKSQILPCADLNLPFKPSLVTKAPIHDTSNPAAPNDSVADNKGIIIALASGAGILIFILILILILIGVLIWKLCNSGNGDKDGRPDGNAAKTGLLNGKKLKIKI